VYTSNYYASTIYVTDNLGAVVVSSSAPLWNGGNAPSLSASTLYIQTFTIVRAFPTKYIISNVSTFS
jgi:hypothetical protein